MMRWLLLVALCPLVGCTISTPFQGPGYDPDKGLVIEGVQTAYVGLTLAVLKKDPKLQSVFWSHVKKVEAALSDRPGFIGYSKRTRLLGNRAWTMTVWTDEASLEAFVRSEVHQTAIRESMNALESAAFARIEINRESIPLSWNHAIAILEARREGYKRSG